jgi:diguanylate cyclase (GGDEF)-like protein/PAS domain S-box-containing protein
MARSNGTAPYSVALFAILTVGILAANFRSRSVKLVLSESLGGAAARRLLPAIVLVPTLIGWLRVEGQNYGLFDTGFGTAISIFSSVLLMVVLIFYYSGTLHKVDLLRARFEKELTRNERQYRNLFDHSQGLICSHDLNGVIITINPAALNALGFEKDEVIGQNLGSLMLPGTDDQLKSYLTNVEHEGLSEGLLSLRAKNGKILIWRYYNILISEPDNAPYVLGHAQDVTLLVQTQQELKNLSHTDDLTGLYNRRGFQTMAEQQIKLERHHGTARGLVLMFADLDGLKQINDKYGHQAGSDAIVAFAKVLRSVLRSADIISRWGGDEFVILTIGSPDETSAMIIDRIHARLRQHNYESDAPYELACSIGIAAVPLDGKKSFETLIAEADQAMYHEKRRRKLEPVALRSGRM